jgi:hypothetical protein
MWPALVVLLIIASKASGKVANVDWGEFHIPMRACELLLCLLLLQQQLRRQQQLAAGNVQPGMMHADF